MTGETHDRRVRDVNLCRGAMRVALLRAFRAFLFLAAGAIVLAAAPRAHAGSYTVHVCDSASGNRTDAISFASNGSNGAYSVCPTDGSGHRIGILARSAFGGGTTGFMTSATATFSAPAGTTINWISGHLAGRGVQGFGSALQSSSDGFQTSRVLADCTQSFCAMSGPDGGIPVSFSIPGSRSVRLLMMCGLAGGCSTASTDAWPYAPGWASMGDMQVNVEDPWAPSLIAGRGAAWNASAWHRGTETVGFNANDNVGIQRMYVSIDGARFPVDRGFGCDYALAVPCVNQALDGAIETTGVSDGHHTIILAALDAAGNWNQTSAPLEVDNHAPDNPTGVSVADGENSWHRLNSFDVSWTNPSGQTAPIVKANYRIYDGDGSMVASGSQSGNGIESLTGLTVPTQGDYTLKIHLEDAAGNTNVAAASDAVHLKYDDVVPGQALPERRNGWVDAAHAAEYVQHIDRPRNPDEVPVSGIDGYAITTDGSDPGSTVTTPADVARGYAADARIIDLAEGTTHFKARAISGAGVPSTVVGAEAIHTDITAPHLSLAGAPNASGWARDPVSLSVSATDPGRLSGMAGVEIFDGDDTHGAYISYSIDGGPVARVRGPLQPLDADGIRGFEGTATATIPIVTDGRHTVSYSATDVAGNESGEKTASFKVDRTAPEFVVFEAQVASDPQLVNVAASDATSGLADGGKIQLRRVGGSDWITLRTAREGAHYYAHIDNTQLPEGNYEFRATVPDQAGNVATGDRNRAGQPQVLHIDPTHVGPYRTSGEVLGGSGIAPADATATVGTKVKVRVVTTVKKRVAKKCKTKRGHRRTRRSCSSKSTLVQRLVSTARVPYAKRATVKGWLTTTHGAPLANAELTVVAKSRTDGARYRAEATARTNARGEFRYSAPSKGGRTLEFLYRGNATYKQSHGRVTLKVPAAVTLKANRKHARNGGSVLFNGKLRGKPYPTKGKIIDLQAFYRGKWRTFATPRTQRSGKWRFRYRFGATRGRVLYRFRVRVRRSADYPYELGYSKTVRITVTG